MEIQQGSAKRMGGAIFTLTYIQECVTYELGTGIPSFRTR
jgi:hypothetical protein